jgi:hypothetical protein
MKNIINLPVLYERFCNENNIYEASLVLRVIFNFVAGSDDLTQVKY